MSKKRQVFKSGPDNLVSPKLEKGMVGHIPYYDNGNGHRFTLEEMIAIILAEQETWGRLVLGLDKIEFTGKDIIIAILDTGIWHLHEELKGKIIMELSRNFTSRDVKNFRDRQGHGTHCASLAGAWGNNGVGFKGVAPGVKFIICKVLGDDGSGTIPNIVSAMDYIVELKKQNIPVHIASMSLGSDDSFQEMIDACGRMAAANIHLFTAAGNNGDNKWTNKIGSPADGALYHAMYAVASINAKRLRSWYSSYGKAVNIATPGEECWGAFVGTGDETDIYKPLSGTSMAAPHGAGLGAICLEVFNKEKLSLPTPAELRELFHQTADDAGEKGRDDMYGHGIPNPAKLIAAIKAKAKKPGTNMPSMLIM